MNKHFCLIFEFMCSINNRNSIIEIQLFHQENKYFMYYIGKIYGNNNKIIRSHFNSRRFYKILINIEFVFKSGTYNSLMSSLIILTTKHMILIHTINFSSISKSL